MTALLPIHNLNAAQIRFKSRCTIYELQDNGFPVVAYLCDDHRRNQAMYGMFASSANIEGEPFLVSQPCDENRPLCLLMDPGHIFKSIKNNWECQAIELSRWTYGTRSNPVSCKVVAFASRTFFGQAFFTKISAFIQSCCYSKQIRKAGGRLRRKGFRQ